MVRAAELAADDLRKTGRITGKLKFTVDESATELSVDAELRPGRLGLGLISAGSAWFHVPA